MAEKSDKPDDDGNNFISDHTGDKKVSAGHGGIAIGGSVQGSNIVFGNNNVVVNSSTNHAPLFEELYRELDIRKDLPADKKEDIKAELQEIQSALDESNPDETFIARRFRNIKRMAPEIVEVAFETLKNPIGGVAEVVKRIAKKMAEEANTG
jgi:beta-phosphoglucomutase-like phosphatase (HAD superfamily)